MNYKKKSKYFRNILLLSGLITIISSVIFCAYVLGQNATDNAFQDQAISNTSLMLIVLTLIIGGMILLFFEIAIIPGFGITGITGILLLASGVFIGFWKLDLMTAIIINAVSFFLLLLLLWWAFYIFPKTKMGKEFSLETKLSVEDGYTAIRDLSNLLGKEGVTLTDLRPSGFAKIEEERIDVISDGEFIQKGAKVKVIKIKGGSVIVSRVVES